MDQIHQNIFSFVNGYEDGGSQPPWTKIKPILCYIPFRQAKNGKYLTGIFKTATYQNVSPPPLTINSQINKLLMK